MKHIELIWDVERPEALNGLEALLDDVAGACLAVEGIDGAGFGIRIVDGATIRTLNREMRNIDRVSLPFCGSAVPCCQRILPSCRAKRQSPHRKGPAGTESELLSHLRSASSEAQRKSRLRLPARSVRLPGLLSCAPEQNHPKKKYERKRNHLTVRVYWQLPHERQTQACCGCKPRRNSETASPRSGNSCEWRTAGRSCPPVRGLHGRRLSETAVWHRRVPSGYTGRSGSLQLPGKTLHELPVFHPAAFRFHQNCF